MAELTRMSLAFINEWQKLSNAHQELVLKLLNDRRHDFVNSSDEQRNAFAVAAYLLAELVPTKTKE